MAKIYSLSWQAQARVQAQAQLTLRDREAGAVDAPPDGSLFARYGHDPAGFIRDCFIWRPGEHPTDYQLEAAEKLELHGRLSLRGPHGLGKTAVVSWLVLWFSLVNDGYTDWKIPITASAWRQLTKFAWPEIHKWSKKINWGMIGREPFKVRYELLDLNLKLSTGEAFAMASDNPALIEGAHATRLLYVFDESKEIPDGTWDAAEGAFSTGDAKWLSVSTPGEPNGRFFEIQSRKKGHEDWYAMHVTREMVIAAGRMNPDWAAKKKDLWGEKSAQYQNRVEGNFATSEEDSVIPLTWIEKANARWLEWKDSGLPPDEPFTSLGVDVARSGEDRTVLAKRYGSLISELQSHHLEDTMETTGRVVAILQHLKGKAIVDVIGVGAGVVDRLKELRYDVEAFNASVATDFMDQSGEWGFKNLRSAAWWHMRELLDPDNGWDIALPPDDPNNEFANLTADLTTPKWKVMSNGIIQVESKDDIKKRLGHSTDCGDAVIMAFWEYGASLSDWNNALHRDNGKEDQSWE